MQQGGVTIRLGPGACSDLETSARYFAAIAFPERGEQAERTRAVEGWVGAYLHAANRIDRSSEPFADPRLNSYLGRDPRWCRKQLRTTFRRLSDRSKFAQALRPWILQALGSSADPIEGIAKFSQRQIALYLCNHDPARTDNFLTRVCRPSRPVTHLMFAQERVFHTLGFEAEQQPMQMLPIDLLAAAPFVELLVGVANVYRPLILRNREFRVTDAGLLQLEWVAANTEF